MPVRLGFRRLLTVTLIAWTSFLAKADDTQVQDSAISAGPSSAELVELGKAIYLESCADCHGAGGEGVEGAYEEPLVGDDSTGQLAKIIADTMPEGSPEDCIGEDALAVAEYARYAFYSEAAQIRNRPPRVMLARLTGPQLRQSISDLFAKFYGVPSSTDAYGLQATYYDGDRWKREEKKIERTDPIIDFDFGHESPGEGIKAEGFSIRWEGGVLVRESGRYEIIVRSTCSFVLKLGNDEREFINNYVQSGDKSEFRRTIFLTAGRVYPVRIDFRQRERKTELPPANISLSWKPPGGVEQVIPNRNLISKWVPPAYALQAELPPDDRSYGYERGIAVNRQWDESTTAAALEFSEVAFNELWPHYRRQHRSEPDGDRAKLGEFLSEIVETAFRRPLSADLRERYIDAQLSQEPDDAEAVKRVLLLALKSPRFLYPGINEDMTVSEQVASQIALVMFDSIPVDQQLVEGGRKGRFTTEQSVREVAERFVDDYRVRAKTRELLEGWLNLSHFGEIGKDAERFAGFDAALVSDLKASLEVFLDSVVWSDQSDFRQFFLSDSSYTTPKVSNFYGGQWLPSEEFTKAQSIAPTVKSDLHAGLLTHPYLMSGLAYYDATSPIHRGVFLFRYMLGRVLKPPAEAFTPLSPDLHPDLTTRERVNLQTSPESCQVCHKKINGLGFTLEHYDPVGRFRLNEGEKPIDSEGSYVDRAGKPIEFEDVKDVARFLANSDDAHRAFVARAFQHFVKQPPAAFGADTLERLTESFRSNNFNVRKLIVEICVLATKPLLVDSQSQVASR